MALSNHKFGKYFNNLKNSRDVSERDDIAGQCFLDIMTTTSPQYA